MVKRGLAEGRMVEKKGTCRYARVGWKTERIKKNKRR